MWGQLGQGLLGAGIGALAGKALGGDKGMMAGGLLGGLGGYNFDALSSGLGSMLGGEEAMYSAMDSTGNMIQKPMANSQLAQGALSYQPQGLFGMNGNQMESIGTLGTAIKGGGDMYQAYEASGRADEQIGLYERMIQNQLDTQQRQEDRENIMESNLQGGFANSKLARQTLPTYY